MPGSERDFETAEALDSDEDPVALRLSVAQIAECQTSPGIGEGAGLVVFRGRDELTHGNGEATRVAESAKRN